MISKVAKGQSITAAHNNQIVNAINQLDKSFSEYKGIDYSSADAVTNPVLDLIAIPSPCSDSVYLAYFNSQNSLDNIVKYNGEWATYCIPSALKQTLAGLQALENIDYCTNYYNIGRQLTLDTQCTDNTINLTIFKEKDSECSESSECSKPTYFYTLADKTSICSLGDDYVILDTYAIGCFKNGEITQIHEGILIDSNTTLNTDTLIPDLQLSSITIEEYVDEETNKVEKYLTLFNFCESFGDAIEERDFTKRQNDEYKVLLSKKDGEKITLTYGQPDKHFILNDLSAVEPGDFVLPRSLSSVQNIVVGLGLNSTQTDKDGNVLKEIATICFTSPYKQITPCGGSYSEYGVLSGDWVFTLDKDNKSGIFKNYHPISICENLQDDYLCVKFKPDINEYQIFGPKMEFEKVTSEDLVGNDKEGFKYDGGTNTWKLKLVKDDLSAGQYIQLDQSDNTKPTVINGPDIVLKSINPCDENQSNRIEYKKDIHTWEVYISRTNAEAGDYIQIKDGKINGPNIKVEKGDELKAEYNPHEWTITVPENVSDLSAGQYIKIEDNNINGPNIVFKQHTNCGTTTSNGTASYDTTTNTWTLDVNAEGTLEAGDYIQINDGRIDGPAIEVEKGNELKAGYANHKWTITVPENVSDLSAGQYITIENNQINGANIVIDSGCGKIPGTATYANGTWTISLPKSGEVDFDGVKSLNGLKDEVTITSNTLNVTQSGQNINIEFPDEGVQYDFDEEWFIVTDNKVTINECAVAAVAKTVIPDIEASITPTVTMSIDEVSDGQRNRCGDIMATITNSSAFSATARFTTSWRQ